MILDITIENALRMPDPLSGLRAVAVGMRQKGREQTAILEFFKRNRDALREAGREAEDVVLEVMDFLVGWCSPHMHLTRKCP